MVVTRWAAMLVVSTASLAAALPVQAASSVTKAFLDNLIPNIDFLDRSSRFALKNSKSARILAFAFGEAREQTLAANAVYDWTLAGASEMVASADQDARRATLEGKDLDRSATGSTRPQALPIVATKREQPTIDDRLPRGQEDLDSMEGLDGPAFDAEYKEKQLDALQQVQADYRDYVVKGDDPTLKRLAARELPKIERRLADIGKL